MAVHCYPSLNVPPSLTLSCLSLSLPLCRAINYDEKDPFLCNSCGFSKYAKFELTVEAKTCSAVDPIENEDDRKKVRRGRRSSLVASHSVM